MHLVKPRSCLLLVGFQFGMHQSDCMRIIHNRRLKANTQHPLHMSNTVQFVTFLLEWGSIYGILMMPVFRLSKILQSTDWFIHFAAIQAKEDRIHISKHCEIAVRAQSKVNRTTENPMASCF